MWNMGHGRGHENDQGMAHMEAVGSMNGTTLRMTVHESSIRLLTAHESSIRLQTVHESSIRLQTTEGSVTQ